VPAEEQTSSGASPAAPAWPGGHGAVAHVDGAASGRVRAPGHALPEPTRAHRLTAGPCVLAVDGGGRDLEAITRQLGGEPAAPGDGHHLAVSIGPLPPGPRRLIGTGTYAAVDEGLVLLRGGGKRPVEVLVPFEQLGSRPTLRATPGSAPLPLLVEIVNLTALGTGVLPLHAAAFDLDGLGVLVTGWSRSGKTETLLAFGGRGAAYVGDEWVYLHEDGHLTGLPEPMRVWSWHLAELGATASLPPRTRAKLALLDRVTEGGPGLDRRLPAAARKVRHLLREQRNVRLPPAELLPVVDRTHLDVLVLTESHDQPEITVEEVRPADVAARIAAMLPVERAGLLTAYQAFRYAFPDRRSALLESAERREAALLAERLDGVMTLLVRHPYPFRFEAMADVLTPWLEGS
jgi:hypothetical protein